jgi:hypothetical protein
VKPLWLLPALLATAGADSPPRITVMLGEGEVFGCEAVWETDCGTNLRGCGYWEDSDFDCLDFVTVIGDADD